MLANAHRGANIPPIRPMASCVACLALSNVNKNALAQVHVLHNRGFAPSYARRSSQHHVGPGSSDVGQLLWGGVTRKQRAQRSKTSNQFRRGGEEVDEGKEGKETYRAARLAARL